MKQLFLNACLLLLCFGKLSAQQQADSALLLTTQLDFIASRIAVSSNALSPVVAVGGKGKLAYYSTDGRLIGYPKFPENAVPDVLCWSGDGELLAVLCKKSKRIFLYNLAGKLLQQWDTGVESKSTIVDIVWMRLEGQLVSCYADGLLRFWTPASDHPLMDIRDRQLFIWKGVEDGKANYMTGPFSNGIIPPGVAAIDCSPDGSMVLTAHPADGTVRRLQFLGSGIAEQSWKAPFSYGFLVLRYSPDGAHFAAINGVTKSLWIQGMDSIGRSVSLIPGIMSTMHYNADGSRLYLARGGDLQETDQWGNLRYTIHTGFEISDFALNSDANWGVLLSYKQLAFYQLRPELPKPTLKPLVENVFEPE